MFPVSGPRTAGRFTPLELDSMILSWLSLRKIRVAQLLGEEDFVWWIWWRALLHPQKHRQVLTVVV